jgi:hypothetical protein
LLWNIWKFLCFVEWLYIICSVRLVYWKKLKALAQIYFFWNNA